LGTPIAVSPIEKKSAIAWRKNLMNVGTERVIRGYVAKLV